ncbi:MAG: hypothetical protein FD161_3624 [Limisphaerales bacterium]|nr:MAG: hypothetical protein FD161_3624 [Limisphaerales bacterium]KAG0507560.1 MAG: hypothetical protein E1N63_3290 [Limisphaerales bacterium]TXT47998.1 MAG: hypothetical protein FD140_3833 [Limisphaerales bacterium]
MVLLALFGSALNAFAFYLALHERGDSGAMAMFATAWLNLAFPFGAACVLIHHATPGAAKRRANFPKWLEIAFWLNSVGWFAFALEQWRVEFGSFTHHLWWLAWLWS